MLNHQEQHQAHIITQARTELTQIERKLEEPPTLGLLVHHKDGDKFNNSMENLVTVCNSCHVSHHRRRTKRVSREKAQTDKWRRNYYAQKNALKDAVNKTKKGTSTEKNKLNLARVAN